MRLIRQGVWYNDTHEGIPSGSQEKFNCVATIGNFDGVHIGHQTIIKQLKMIAKEYQLPATVITFEPSPQAFFSKGKMNQRLTPFREKFEILQTLMVDIMCVIRFNAYMASLEAKDFVRHILVEKLGIRHLIVGEDFRFGKNRLGDINLLQREGEAFGFQVSIVPTVLSEGHKVSSRTIREVILQGNLSDAEKWLGRKIKSKKSQKGEIK